MKGSTGCNGVKGLRVVGCGLSDLVHALFPEEAIPPPASLVDTDEHG